ncbi:DUF6980 family protein [Streptomyces wuyuanensis]|uniref:DUF6980 family protein n=1 Tax=Streptomyces wuyuanensis TaxID=1196353 RepID=UPI003427E69D
MGHEEASKAHCCETMRHHVAWDCDVHVDPYACPDALVHFMPRYQEYGLLIHDGGSSYVELLFCPWCGARLPESQRDRWFDAMEERGIDPWGDEIPDIFRDDRWLRDRATTSQDPAGNRRRPPNPMGGDQEADKSLTRPSSGDDISG